jgi:transposase
MTVTVLDRALVAGDAGGVTGERQERPDPEVPQKARRRTFTAQYKLDVVAEYDAAATGEKGAVLRREGLYSSHVIEWRRARDAGALAGPARRRGRPAADPRDAQIARLQKDKAKLEQELAKARFVVDVQSKLQALLASDLTSAGSASGWFGGLPDSRAAFGRSCFLAEVNRSPEGRRGECAARCRRRRGAVRIVPVPCRVL